MALSLVFVCAQVRRELDRAVHRRAGYIGPIAKHLVKRAALRANGVEDLLASLAAERVVEADRRTFAERCRQRIK